MTILPTDKLACRTTIVSLRVYFFLNIRVLQFWIILEYYPTDALLDLDLVTTLILRILQLSIIL